jgi:hypothetical protein
VQSSDQPGPSPPVYDGLTDRFPATDRDNTIKSIEELLSSGRSVGEILAAMGTPPAVSEQCEPEIPQCRHVRNSTAVPHGSAGQSLLIVTESDCSNTTAPRPVSNPERSVAGSRRRRMAWPAACVVFCGAALAGMAILFDHSAVIGKSISTPNVAAADMPSTVIERGTEAVVASTPTIEVPAIVEASPNQPATVSAPAEKNFLAAEPQKVPLVAASLLPPPFGNTAPGPKAISNRTVKTSPQTEHSRVQATRRMRSVGPKKYVRQTGRPYYAPLRQQYIALRQVSLPDRGWGGGQYGPSPFSENGQ